MYIHIYDIYICIEFARHITDEDVFNMFEDVEKKNN